MPILTLPSEISAADAGIAAAARMAADMRYVSFTCNLLPDDQPPREYRRLLSTTLDGRLTISLQATERSNTPAMQRRARSRARTCTPRRYRAGEAALIST